MKCAFDDATARTAGGAIAIVEVCSLSAVQARIRTVTQMRLIALAENDGSGLLELADYICVASRVAVEQSEAAGGRLHVGVARAFGCDGIFDEDRYALKRTNRVSGGAPSVGLGREREAAMIGLEDGA